MKSTDNKTENILFTLLMCLTIVYFGTHVIIALIK